MVPMEFLVWRMRPVCLRGYLGRCSMKLFGNARPLRKVPRKLSIHHLDDILIRGGMDWVVEHVLCTLPEL